VGEEEGLGLLAVLEVEVAVEEGATRTKIDSNSSSSNNNNSITSSSNNSSSNKSLACSVLPVPEQTQWPCLGASAAAAAAVELPSKIGKTETGTESEVKTGTETETEIGPDVKRRTAPLLQLRLL